MNKLSNLEQYAVYAQGRVIFSEAIIEKDLERKFSKEIIDYKVDKEEYAIEASKYSENKESYENSINEYKKENEDKFQISYAIPNINEMFIDFNFDTKDLTLEECIQGYKYCNEKLKSFDKSSIAGLIERVSIKPEYNKEYKEFCNKMREIHNYPTSTKICENLEKKVKVTKSKLCLNREKSSDTTAYEKLENKFINFKRGEL